MDLGLRGRVALVTGASGGIGSATARLLAAEGADVVIAYGRSGDAAGRVAEDVRAAGRRAWCVGMDVSDAASVERGMRDVHAATGGSLDAVVLSAGYNVVTPLDALGPAEWDDVVQGNPHQECRSRARARRA